jgi:hypothetical protein
LKEKIRRIGGCKGRLSRVYLTGASAGVIADLGGRGATLNMGWATSGAMMNSGGMSSGVMLKFGIIHRCDAEHEGKSSRIEVNVGGHVPIM